MKFFKIILLFVYVYLCSFIMISDFDMIWNKEFTGKNFVEFVRRSMLLEEVSINKAEVR